jgi:AAHS family 4-hydroxybenzoate transporter-like MFS transporter
MTAPATIDVSDLIDRSKVSSLQVRVFWLCTLCLFMDGFDLQALGYAAPAIVQDFKVPNEALGPVFGAANIGLLIGTLFFSMLADKIGRRPVLIAATAFFAVVTLFTARATSIEALLVLRLIAGIGYGSIVPNVTALVGEYSPQNRRITAIMIMTTLGLNGGAMVGGFVSAWLIPTFGWASVFYVGGVAPLVIAVVMFFGLPESLPFLVLRHRKPEQVASWVKRIDPTAVAALAATSYPTSLRSSGVGWALGVGRVGAIVGPVIGGELMRLDWSTRHIFLAAAMPAVVSTAAMFSMRLAIRPRPAPR